PRNVRGAAERRPAAARLARSAPLSVHRCGVSRSVDARCPTRLGQRHPLDPAVDRSAGFSLVRKVALRTLSNQLFPAVLRPRPRLPRRRNAEPALGSLRATDPAYWHRSSALRRDLAAA